MKLKRVFAGLLSATFCLSMMTACSGSTKTESVAEGTQTSSNEKNAEDAKVQESKQDSQDSSDKQDEKVMHKLYIRDADKHDGMTATFLNSVTGETQDITMEKGEETADYVMFSCEADVNAFNMVHLSYGDTVSMDIAFNQIVGGWNLANDELLPYALGQEPDYDPQFETKTFQFDGYDKTVYIWTPKDYDAKAEEKYATIYMLDGQSVLATGKDRGMDSDVMCWNVAESVESMMSVTENKAIIVAIETVGSKTATRDDELVPDLGEIAVPKGMDAIPEEDMSRKRGGAFADFICDTVMPFVQKNYNVYTDARHTALAGSSLGGLESFYAVLEHADKFGTAGVMSATFTMFSEEDWTKFLSDKVTMKNAPFIYMYAGRYNGDNGDVTMQMYNEMLKQGYPKDRVIFNKYEIGEHFPTFWRNIYPEFLEAVFTQKVTALPVGVPVEYIDTSDPFEFNPEDFSVDENDTRPAEIRNYVYYDNSETKWNTVWAYWWGGRTINPLTGEDYGGEWPGVQMEQIEGTDIYRVIAPAGATNIIFDSGVTDPEVAEGKEAYQTIDLLYTIGMRGKVYKIDLNTPPKAGKGAEKTKFRYSEGTWEDYYP